MLSQHLYYTFKPYLPWRLRMGVRRVLAKRLRQEHVATWPIDERAARPPDNWPGWPDGKKFAFVLTHDVESPQGLAKCERLAALEAERGYRSTFNFIPEGPYTVPPELRRNLTAGGFEVGVHDLRHDGWLFKSRKGFQEQAVRINRYLKEWGVRGFRSGFMLRNLGWLHQLDLQYDASTFDTDPFEMQSDGTRTIFPFWVEGPKDEASVNGRGGYLELPYTLPQDSTLFLLLRESTPDIWLRKLDWIAGNGGMALVNVHPDYLRLPDEPQSDRTYPVRHYTDLLDHVRDRYGDSVWCPVAGELAEYVAQFGPRLPRRRKRVCMITHSFYENDNRVTRYAAALAARGDSVDVLALRRSPLSPGAETIDGVRLHRILRRSGKQERAKAAYLWSWLRFLGRTTAWMIRETRRHPFDLVHVHNMPDFLTLAAWYPRHRGAKVILDIHDIVPEFYASKFGTKSHSTGRAILAWTERHSARSADHIIISNHLWLERYATRTGTSDLCSVFINNVDTAVFRPLPRTRQDDTCIILFPGGLQWHQGLDIAIKAFAHISRAMPNAEFHIYGDGNMKPSLLALTAELGLQERVKFFDPVEVRQVAQVMANADLGIVPKRADSFGNEAYSTKIMEFMSVGVPVVISSTKIDRFYFDDSVVRFFESGNVEALAAAVVNLLREHPVRQRLVERALAYANHHSWERRQEDYFRLVDQLIATGSATPITEIPSEVEPPPQTDLEETHAASAAESVTTQT